MSVVAVGINHRVADVGLLERLSFSPEELPKSLARLAQSDHVSEAVILSTCNRVEAYVKASRFHPASAEVHEFLAEDRGVPHDEFAQQTYTYFDEAATAHLFSVASGLDSLVVGETEIQGQVKEAFALAQAEGAVGRTLSALFRRALEVSKRVRTETGISKNASSVSSAAVALASDVLGGLSGRRVVVMGAGEAGQGAARALKSAGAAELVVANRSLDRAVEVAGRVGGIAVPLAELDARVRDADILIASTRTEELVIDTPRVEAMSRARERRPLLIVDIAVPRDVDPSASSVDGVTLLDMDDLRRFAADGLAQRAAEAARGHEIIADEVERFVADEMAARYGSLIAELRARAEEVRSAEMARFASHLASLDPDSQGAIDALTRSLVNKLLHGPTVRMRESAATPAGETLADALATLFELGSPIDGDDAQSENDGVGDEEIR